MQKTIENLFGQNERVSLPMPLYQADHSLEDYGTGVSLVGIWLGPRTGRMVIATDSKWDDGRGRCRGVRFQEVDESDFLRACRIARIEPPIAGDEL